MTTTLDTQPYHLPSLPPFSHYSKPSSFKRHKTSSSSFSSPHSLPDKFTKSRAVGQSHRDNEKQHIETLLHDVQGLQDDNVLLFALFCASAKNHHTYMWDTAIHPDRIEMVSPWDRPEDYMVSSARDASTMGLVKLPRAAEETLGQSWISCSLAIVLLEFVVIRRNMAAGNEHNPHILASGRKRRRGTFRNPPGVAHLENLCAWALRLFRNDALRLGAANPRQFVDHKFGSLALMLRKWSHYEHLYNPNAFDPSEQCDIHDQPGSPISPDAVEFAPLLVDFVPLYMNPAKKRGEGAKTCSRCNVVKVTGSGHGRSKCADGFSISSLVPYPACPPVTDLEEDSLESSGAGEE